MLIHIFENEIYINIWQRILIVKPDVTVEGLWRLKMTTLLGRLASSTRNRRRTVKQGKSSSFP